MLPMSPRVRQVLEARWASVDKPEEGSIFPAPTRSGHVEKSTLKKQHKKVFEKVNEETKKNYDKPVRPFVLYDLRHTFLTRLGESGCDVWTLARIAGHSNIKQSSRYVHPSHDAVVGAMERLGGHKIGHTDEQPSQPTTNRTLLTQ
jgi:integrase